MTAQKQKLAFVVVALSLACLEAMANSKSNAKTNRVVRPKYIAQNKVAVPPSGRSSESAAEIMRAKSRSLLQLQLEMEAQAYGTEVPDRPQLSRSTLLKTHLKYESGAGDWGGKVDLFAGRYLDLKYSILSVKEGYVSYQSGGSISNEGSAWSWALGRKREFWSSADETWDLGLWEPKYLEEPLRPVEQGISGLLLNFKDSSGLEIAAYASPIFIPTMSPSLSEKNGDLVSESRWTRPPSSSTELIGTNTRLIYELKIPEISSLIAKPGAGMRMSFGKQERRGFWVSTNFARKPVNALQIKYDYKLAVSSTASGSSSAGEGLINVSPTVSYHRLWGADVGANYDSVRMALSYLEDAPETGLPKDDFSADGIARTEWIQQAPQPVKVYAAHIDWQLRGLLRDPIQFELDYLTAKTSPTRDLNSMGEDKGSLLPHRIPFTNAVQFKTEFLMFAGSLPLTTSFRYLRDFDQLGSIYSATWRAGVLRNLQVHVGFDILGPDDGSEANTDNRFLNSFRTNDRVFGGASYVF